MSSRGSVSTSSTNDHGSPLHLVMGASGFLGSHVVRELLARGERVRAMVREASSLRALEGLDVDLVYGDVHDPASVRAAMADCDVVQYCVVDTRAWLRDPAPLWSTNVEVLPSVMEAALDAGVRRFVFTSTLATMAIDKHRPVDESLPHNWSAKGGPYVASRVTAEDLVLTFARDRGLPAVAMCVANTYGPRDHQPTPHGSLLYGAALGRMPFHVRGAGSEVVAIDDAARAMVLAAEHGRVGERYIVSERWMTQREVLEIAADVGGVDPPRWSLPTQAIQALGLLGEIRGRLRGRDVPLTRTTARLMHVMTPLDHSKAVRDLGWSPRPAPDAVSEAAEWFLDQRAARRASRAT